MGAYCYTKRFYEVKPDPNNIWPKFDLDVWDSKLESLSNYIHMFEDGMYVSARLVYKDNTITGRVTIDWEYHATNFYSDGSPVIENKPHYTQEELAYIINTYSNLGIIMEPDGEVSGSYPE